VKKIIFLFLAIVIIAVSSGIVYLNNVILPTKVKSWISDGISYKTGKKVTLGSVKVNILRGLTLKDLKIYDEAGELINIREASCGFMIFPVFRKKVIIPYVNIKSPAVFLERYPDNSFNLQKIFVPKEGSPGDKRPGFDISVYRISITNANLYFKDNTLNPPLKKEIKKIDLFLGLSMPTSVKFKISGRLPPDPNTVFRAIGEYRIPKQELSAKINLDDFAPKEAEPYYRNSGISVPKGKMDGDINLEYKNSRFVFSGKLSIDACRLEGLQFAKTLDNISGNLVFDDAGLSSDKLSVTLGAIPLQANIRIADYSKPVVTVNIPQIGLDQLPGLLKSEFKFDFPGNAQGLAGFTLYARLIPDTGIWSVSGYVDTSGARIKLDRLPWAIENLTGRLKFSSDRIDWETLRFTVNGIQYKTGGSWQDFVHPRIQVSLDSADFSVKTSFTVRGTDFSFSKFDGKYLNSEFSATGSVDTSKPASPFADIAGRLDIDLGDLKKIFLKSAEQFDKAGLAGRAGINFNFIGKPDDFRNCVLQAKVSCPVLSAYGLKSSGSLSFDYAQSEGRADISELILPFYGGLIQGGGMVDFNAQPFPFKAAVNLKGVRIEKLKLDTPLKDEDIAGKVDANIRLSGFSGDISKLSGSGDISVNDGKLWQLNLFKGLGSLLFVRDFTNIVFTKGSCSFNLKDKYFYAEKLVMNSGIADLEGKVKIGFDSAIDAVLNVHILNENVPLSGTFKDVATAIIGQAGRFGVIKITGTLKDPKHTFEPAVGDILVGLKNMIMGN
jgi:hypothetical protein